MSHCAACNAEYDREVRGVFSNEALGLCLKCAHISNATALSDDYDPAQPQRGRIHEAWRPTPAVTQPCHMSDDL
ncbi:MAG: hypothetical protein M0P95_17930 [Sulfuritalea sp.]|jgi:hypothetical protein|nr:hypothetical protein [Sulfuritalea sp.]